MKNRRLNRSLFKLALESGEIPPVTEGTPSGSGEEAQTLTGTVAAVSEQPANEAASNVSTLSVEDQEAAAAAAAETPAASDAVEGVAPETDPAAALATVDEVAGGTEVVAEAPVAAAPEATTVTVSVTAANPETGEPAKTDVTVNTPTEAGETGAAEEAAAEVAEATADADAVLAASGAEPVTGSETGGEISIDAPVDTAATAVEEPAATAEPAAAESPAETAEVPEAPAEVAAAEEPAATAAAEETPAVEEPAAATAETPAEEAPGEAAPTGEVPEASDEEPVVSAEDLLIIDSDGAAAAAELDAAEEAAFVVDEIDDEVGQSEKIIETMEGFVEILKVGLQNGGVHEDTAKTIKLSMEHFASVLEMDEPMGIPSMESFADVDSRPEANRLTMEDIKEKIDVIWKAIISTLKSGLDWLSQFAAKIISSNARLKARGEGVMKSAEALGETQAQPVELPEGVAKRLVMGNALPSNLVGAVQSAVDFGIKASANQEVSVVSQALKELGDLSNNFKDPDRYAADSAGLRATIEKLVGALLKKNPEAESKFGIAAAPQETVLYTSDLFPGNRVIYSYMPVSPAGLKSFRIGVQVVETKANLAAQVPALNKAVIAALGKTAVEYVDSVASTGEAIKRLTQMASTFSNLYSRVSAASNDEDKPGVKESIRNFLSVVKASTHIAKGLHQPGLAVASSAVAGALDYASASLKAYSAKKEEPAAA